MLLVYRVVCREQGISIYIYPQLGRDVFVSVPVWCCLVGGGGNPAYTEYIWVLVWLNVPSTPPLCMHACIFFINHFAAWYLQSFCQTWVLVVDSETVQEHCLYNLVLKYVVVSILRRNKLVSEQSKSAVVKSRVFFGAPVLLCACWVCTWWFFMYVSEVLRRVWWHFLCKYWSNF